MGVPIDDDLDATDETHFHALCWHHTPAPDNDHVPDLVPAPGVDSVVLDIGNTIYLLKINANGRMNAISASIGIETPMTLSNLSNAGSLAGPGSIA